ncbi:MAG: glycoside hydrolase family 1 protein [Acidobacteriaceae bacterium]|nr:glycoside hydrolase family 1 protein [Acidobacteriaceae bacterium]
MAQFMFATGIENSYPTIALPDGRSKRVDEMEKCGHYTYWREDFELVRELGVSFLRYGPPYFKTHLGPGRYDWEFSDATFARLRQMKITPIVDLCHFGVPDWVGGFQNTDWPELFADYAQAFAQRFPWVRFYTPVNEIHVAATFSARYGWWNERLASDAAFVRALHNLCKANVLAMHAILDVNPKAIFILSETSEYYHPKSPACAAEAHILNQRRFLSLDMTYGHPVTFEMYEYLLDNGMTREDYHWFGKNHRKEHCVMGTDYYKTNEHLVNEDGSLSEAGEIFGYYVITHQYFDRYHLPVMHTETNLPDAEWAPAWIRKEWANVQKLHEDGLPMIGFTYYSLTDQVDWDTALREDNGRINPLGLYDLERKIRPAGKTYQEIIEQWGRLLPTQSHSLYLNC